MSNQPIGDHALLSDCHGAALVDRRGSVEWWCVPDVDSPSVFARILDDDAGHLRLAPVADATVTRRYVDASLVLCTTFTTGDGTLEVTDALAMAPGTRGHDLGRDVPHLLLRRAVCTVGRVEVALEVAPRPEYGLTQPLVRPVEGGATVRGGPTTLRVSTDLDLAVEPGGVRGRRVLQPGEEVAVAVQYASSWGDLPAAHESDAIARRLDDTVEAWQSWSDQHQQFTGPWRDLVDHSGRVLQGLIHQPTGAMVAAPTTSLAEEVGGTRNWDYRYAWVRDASFALKALWVAACPDEAHQFLDFLTTAATSVHHTHELQVMFGIHGERDLAERTLDHLAGWRDSRPVRVGNGAWDQRQLDVYGEFLDAIHRLRHQVGTLQPPERDFLVALADTAADAWDQPDQGLWEVRGEPRHHLHSKLMCWVALDRAIDLASWLDAVDRVPDWEQARGTIRTAIEQRGFDAEVGAFTQAFGHPDLDASALVVSLVGFLPPDDERVLATIDAIADRLTDDHGLVYRYCAADGLEGDEGTFLLCTFWLAEALARAGQVERARGVFERAVAFRNDVDLLAEEVHPRTGELLGNFPQAFSHIGLVNAAWAIQQAQDHGRVPHPTDDPIPTTPDRGSPPRGPA